MVKGLDAAQRKWEDIRHERDLEEARLGLLDVSHFFNTLESIEVSDSESGSWETVWEFSDPESFNREPTESSELGV